MASPAHIQSRSQAYKIITQHGDMLVVKQSYSSVGDQHQQQHFSAPSSHPSSHPSQQQAEHQHQPHQGAPVRPVIMTFHDLGLNSELQFAKFFHLQEVAQMLRNFTILHVNFMGQEFVCPAQAQPVDCGGDAASDVLPAENNNNNNTESDDDADLVSCQSACDDEQAWSQPAAPLPDDFKYPASEQLVECIVDVCTQLKVRSFIGFAVGAGGHVLASLALARPDLVDGMFLVNPATSKCTITEWLHFKISAIAASHQVGHSAGHELAAESGGGGGLKRLLADADAARAQPGEPGEPAASSSKLRWLHLSKNFRHLSGQQQPAQQVHARRRSSVEPEREKQRPPAEYLLYHHFGPALFQRMRRSSSESKACESPPQTPPQRRQRKLLRLASRSSSDGSTTSSVGGELAVKPAHARRRKQQVHAKSLGAGGGGARLRSLSSAQLGSFGCERLKLGYVQAVYRDYFGQVNSHNLWLFAQSFVKRHTLNLRKDCGPAAAAAAAAALGASMSLMKMSPSNQQQQQQQVIQNNDINNNNGEPDHAQIAGTKVRKTFACQTLIMCSSVQMHCERAQKLASLLNPLQATLIKTEQLLVLDEKPDKVCQAMRLFLQGIGYSMATYERRLKLASMARHSAGSSESQGSASSNK